MFKKSNSYKLLPAKNSTKKYPIDGVLIKCWIYMVIISVYGEIAMTFTLVMSSHSKPKGNILHSYCHNHQIEIMQWNSFLDER